MSNCRQVATNTIWAMVKLSSKGKNVYKFTFEYGQKWSKVAKRSLPMHYHNL